MDWFVLELVECPSVSRTSAVARMFGPAVSEEYSRVVLAGGGCRCIPPVMVESDTARVADLPMVQSDTAQVSVVPVAGCKFPAVFLGKVALDVVGLRVESEETLLTSMDERAQLVRAAPGVTPEDESEEGAPVLELIEHSVLENPLVDSLQEPMPIMKQLEQAILATASVWEPLEHLHCVVSDDVDFDSFCMAPCDAGGTLGDRGRLWVTFWWTLLRSAIRLSCRPVSVDGHGSRLIRSLGQLFVLNIDMGLTDALAVGHNPDMNMKIKTESPRLAVTPGE